MGAEIFTKFLFFVHNFGYRYARKSFKGSKDADFALVSKKILSQNDRLIGWGPGPGKGGQKKTKYPHLQRTPTEPETDNEKRFLSISSRRLVESVDGLDSSIAQSPGELWPKECEPIYGLSRSLKGTDVLQLFAHQKNS